MQVELLSRLRSPYFLSLLGYCSDNSRKLLVYEFMANGGLQEHLYPVSGGKFNIFLIDCYLIWCADWTVFFSWLLGIMHKENVMKTLLLCNWCHMVPLYLYMWVKACLWSFCLHVLPSLTLIPIFFPVIMKTWRPYCFC